MDDILSEIYDLQYRLGLTANYKGFSYLSYALMLSIEEPNRLKMVTKWIYLDVAKKYDTNWKAVERGMRRAGNIIWTNNRPLLEELACRALYKKPYTSQLLSILTHNILCRKTYGADGEISVDN